MAVAHLSLHWDPAEAVGCIFNAWFGHVPGGCSWGIVHDIMRDVVKGPGPAHVRRVALPGTRAR